MAQTFHQESRNDLSCVCSRRNKWSVVFWFLFSELRTEPRTLRLLGRHSTTELNPQPLVSLLYW